jgi:ATP-dependent RNA helicase DOB1
MFSGDDLFDAFEEAPTLVSRRKSVQGAGGAQAGSDAGDNSVQHDASANALVDATAGEELTDEQYQDTVFGKYLPQDVTAKELAACRVEVAYPPYWTDALAAKFATESAAAEAKHVEPSKTYPFTLDPFQQEAVRCIQRDQSVLVSAHTSAGKTAVAEYAIATALKHKQRVVYTSPIKALSNQKYRELSSEFKDVGLMTGDITINPSASCLVMTTEILRNMLYRGSEVLREVSWVVFDEIHYMKDTNRGVVWEETLILLAPPVKLVFLSATIPNAAGFASWIAKLKRKPCSVVYTEYRPTPLQHYIFPSGGDGVYLVVDEKGAFRERNFQKALAILDKDGNAPNSSSFSSSSSKLGSKRGKEQASLANGGGGGGKKKKRYSKGGNGQGNDISKIVQMVMDNKFFPCIIFSFSKKEVENLALQASRQDFNTEEEKKMIVKIFSSALESLSDDDKRLPAVESMLPLLKNGVGIHHGGLLPILKEVIEIMFQEGLVKCLFATETFAMGLNMPATTVVFADSNKYDGVSFRMLQSGEYIQMSGRAGRRGLDDKGIVILMLSEAPEEPDEVKTMIQGEANALTSSFKLGYNMLLNLLRVEEVTPQFMMSRSFRQFQVNQEAPALQAAYEEKSSQLKALKADMKDYDGIARFFELQDQLQSIKRDTQRVIHDPVHCLRYITPGRLVRLHQEQEKLDWGWGMVTGIKKIQRNTQKGRNDSSAYRATSSSKPTTALSASAGRPDPADEYLMEVIVFAKYDTENTLSNDACVPHADLREGGADPKVQKKVTKMPLSAVVEISTVKMKTGEIPSKKARRFYKQHAKSLRHLMTQTFAANGPPVLHPVTDMKIDDAGLAGRLSTIGELTTQISEHEWATSPDKVVESAKFMDAKALDDEVCELKLKLQNALQDVEMAATLESMKRVLRRLGCTSEANVITTPGRVACEVSTCNELVLTDVVFNGVFNDLSAQELVALVSCFVFEERAEDALVPLPRALQKAYKQLLTSATRVADVMLESRLPVDKEQFVDSFKPQMMTVVLQWCKGDKFSDICKLTSIYEGSIIRCMRRLHELLGQLRSAAQTIGNVPLETKVLEGMALLKRDIVFAASLYL